MENEGTRNRSSSNERQDVDDMHTTDNNCDLQNVVTFCITKQAEDPSEFSLMDNILQWKTKYLRIQ